MSNNIKGVKLPQEIKDDLLDLRYFEPNDVLQFPSSSGLVLSSRPIASVQNVNSV